MDENLTKDELWELIGFIKVSPIRYQTLLTLRNGYLMPSEIAKSTNYRTTQISNALKDLKEKDLVVCMNEKARKGRLYQNTELGFKVIELIEKRSKSI